MVLPQRQIIIAGTIVLALAVFSCLWLTSPWLVWNALPATGQYQVAIMSSLLGTSAVHVAIEQAEPTLKPYLNSFQTLAWSTNQYNQVIALAGQPTVSQQLRLPQQLRQAGWKVQRLGLSIRAIAPQNTLPIPQRRQVALATLAKLFSRPALLVSFQPTTTDLVVSEPLMIEGELHGGELRLIVNHWHGTLPTVTTNDSVITVPGSFIKELPVPVSLTLFDQFRQKFGLAETKVDLASLLGSQTGVRLTIASDGNLSMTTTGDPLSVLMPIKDALVAQDERSRPVRQKFKLPDGTVGYEKIPGTEQPLFTGDFSTTGCLQPIAGKASIWLCQSQNVAVVATSEALARAELATPVQPWAAATNPTAWQALRASQTCQSPANVWLMMACHITNLQAAGNNQGLIIKVKLAQ